MIDSLRIGQELVEHRAIHNIHPINGNGEPRAPRYQSPAEPTEKVARTPRYRAHAGHNRKTDTIVGQPIYVDSEEYYYNSNASGRSRRSYKRNMRDRDERRDPERQQLKHIKDKFPPFKGKNDPKAYLYWDRKMESRFLCHDTYASNKVKIAIS
ncbi:unnamed protein product [Cochlearia groenlandica]